MRRRFSLAKGLTVLGFLIVLFGLWHYIVPPSTLPTPELALRPRPGLHLPATVLDNPDLLTQVAEAGIRWVRVEVRWSDIEPTPHHFVWSPWDRRLQALSDLGLTPLVVLNTSPSWARRPEDRTNPLAPPEDPADFAAFAQAFAERYHSFVRFYQIWDEPNIFPHWGNREADPLGYVYLLQASALAIRHVDPEAVIVSAGLAPTLDPGRVNYNDLKYLRSLYTLGANAWFDVLGWKAYGFASPPTDAPRDDILNFRRFERARYIMRSFGDVQTPIWIVAFGWNAWPEKTIWEHVSPLQKATYLEESYRWVATHTPYVGPMFWAHAYPANSPEATLWGFSLWTPQGEGTAAWEAMRRATRIPVYDVGNHSLPPMRPGETITFPVWGTSVALDVQTGPRWFTWWVEVDDQPAPLLPHDGDGRAYLNAYQPRPRTVRVLLAQDLPLGLHKVVLRPGPGDPIWAISGIAVSASTSVKWVYFFLFLVGTVFVGIASQQFSSLRIRIKYPNRESLSPIFYLGILVSVALTPLATQTFQFGESVYVPVEIAIVTTLLLGIYNLRRSSQYVSIHVSWRCISGIFFIGGLVVMSLYGALTNTPAGVVWFWGRTRVVLPLLLGVLLWWSVLGDSYWATRTTSLLPLALTAGGLFLSVTAFRELADIRPPYHTLRLHGLLDSPNHLALILIRILPFTFTMSQHQLPGWRTVGKISLIFMLSTLALTASRTAWLLGMPIVVLGYYGMRQPRARLAAIFMLLIGGGLILVRGGATLQQRWLIWQGTIKLIRSHLWTGIGMGAFPYVYPRYALPEAWREPLLYHPHNVVLYTLATMGLPLGGLFFILIGYVLYNAPSHHPVYRAARASLLAGLACGLTDAFWALDDLSYLTALALALLLPRPLAEKTQQRSEAVL